ncbi:MAG: 4-demethylwyosine synthase TYW1 [Nanobdellota archaeon]
MSDNTVPMISSDLKDNLEKQHYRIIGTHSAVKVCGWTKHLLKGEGGCYKLQFYGINSHQCLQMTSSFSCANRCIFCWRGYKAPTATQWKWLVDSPKYIVEESLKAQQKLLEGFGGNPKANKIAYEQSKTVRHTALSLTGEPIFYPHLNELIKEFDKRHISTFLVTNGQYPSAIKNLRPVTQLYLSVDAVNETMAKDIGRPLFPDHWKRFKESVTALKHTSSRTTIRITVIRHLNDNHHKGFAQIINEAKPDFIEVKGYMHVGKSQQRLDRNNMPLHEEISFFSRKLKEELDEYEIVSEHEPSRVVLLARKQLYKNGAWHTWIDFDAWSKAKDEGKELSALEYSIPLQKDFKGLYQNTGIKISKQ